MNGLASVRLRALTLFVLLLLVACGSQPTAQPTTAPCLLYTSPSPRD